MFGRPRPQRLEDLPDEVLYQRLLDGELAAFDVLYARYERSLFGFLKRQLGDPAAAEDLFHEAFLAVLREKDARRAARSFRAWLFQVARNLCHNRRRTERRASHAFEVVARVSAEPPEEAAALLEAKEARVALSAAIARLPPPQAELYQLRAAGLSYEEIAQVLEVPLGTVKSRMHELVARMKKEVEPWAAE